MDDNQNEEKQPQEDFDHLIEDASEKLHVDINWMRRISPEEILYLLDHCPYLQIVNPEVSLEEKKLNLVLGDSGWTIHDYGDAMSASLGDLLFGGGDFRILL